MSLTDAAVRNAKPRAKSYKLGDSLGLFLLVQPSGGKLWRMKYRFEGREKKLGIGLYPEVGLREARKRRDEARELLAEGKDPTREKQQAKLRAQAAAANTFGEIAQEFIDKRRRDIDLDAALWTIPATKMKMRKAHRVPLSRQSVAILHAAHTITGPTGFVFPSIRTRARPMSENTVNAGLRRLGFTGDEMTAHGFRAMASTLLNESGRWSPDAIERALAHGDDDRVRAAYHRGAHWRERIEMAQWWSDYLDQLRQGPTTLQPNFGQQAP